MLAGDGPRAQGPLDERGGNGSVRVARQATGRRSRCPADERQEEVAQAALMDGERKARKHGFARPRPHGARSREIERELHLVEPFGLARREEAVLAVDDRVPEGVRRRRDRRYAEDARLEELERALAVREVIDDRGRCDDEPAAGERARGSLPKRQGRVGEGGEGRRQIDVAADEQTGFGLPREQLREGLGDRRQIAIVGIGPAEVRDGRRPPSRVTQGCEQSRQPDKRRVHEVRVHHGVLAEHGGVRRKCRHAAEEVVGGLERAIQAREEPPVLVASGRREVVEKRNERLHVRVEDEVVALEDDGGPLLPRSFDHRLHPGVPRKAEQDHDRVRGEPIEQAGVVDVHDVGGDAGLPELLDTVLAPIAVGRIPAGGDVQHAESGGGGDGADDRTRVVRAPPQLGQLHCGVGPQADQRVLGGMGACLEVLHPPLQALNRGIAVGDRRAVDREVRGNGWGRRGWGRWGCCGGVHRRWNAARWQRRRGFRRFPLETDLLDPVGLGADHEVTGLRPRQALEPAHDRSRQGVLRWRGADSLASHAIDHRRAAAGVGEQPDREILVEEAELAGEAARHHVLEARADHRRMVHVREGRENEAARAEKIAAAAHERARVEPLLQHAQRQDDVEARGRQWRGLVGDEGHAAVACRQEGGEVVARST